MLLFEVTLFVQHGRLSCWLDYRFSVMVLIICMSDSVNMCVLHSQLKRNLYFFQCGHCTNVFK